MTKLSSVARSLSIAGAIAASLSTSPAGAGHSSPLAAQSAAKPYPVEYYYRVKWGHFDEFMELYQRNHYPILLREQKLGRIVSMNATYPVYHTGEAKRWDMRFTIVWKVTCRRLPAPSTANAFGTALVSRS